MIDFREASKILNNYFAIRKNHEHELQDILFDDVKKKIIYRGENKELMKTLVRSEFLRFENFQRYEKIAF